MWAWRRCVLLEDLACGNADRWDNDKRVEGNGYSYHMRLAVIIPAFPAVSHIYASVNSETQADDCQHPQVHQTTTTDPMNWP
jgi:hypothetical protein